MRALALIDGEHYAPVVKAALEELPYEFVAAHVVGGTEKLRGDADYGVTVAADLDAALAEHRPELVVDLSDEPVLGPRERFRLASRVLAAGLPYVGADFRFDPPALEPFPLPSIGIVGTGKRVGKTAITAHAARLYARDRRVVVVAMGRGGPPEPEVATVAPDVETLLELSRSGRHAASDYLETAALAGVETVGCRRCGGGLAGSVAVSNVHEGARLAAELEPGPRPLRRQRRGDPSRRHRAADPRRQRRDRSGRRHGLSERIPPSRLRSRGPDDGRARHGLGGAAPPRARAGADGDPDDAPPAPGRGRQRAQGGVLLDRSASARTSSSPRTSPRSTAPTSSTCRARSPTARRCGPSSRSVEADVFLVELKAAAIDVVAEAASERGVEVVLAGSDVLTADGQDLDAELLRLADQRRPHERASRRASGTSSAASSRRTRRA